MIRPDFPERVGPTQFWRVVFRTIAVSFLLTVADMKCSGADTGISLADESQAAGPASTQAGDAAFSGMPADLARSQLLQWVVKARAAEADATKVTALWADESQIGSMTAEECLDHLMESFAVVDEPVRNLVTACRTGGTYPKLTWEGHRSDPFFRHQVQLWEARALTQHRRYDEALSLLENLPPEQVVDPASLFFYRAVCRLRLLKTAEAAEDLVLLLRHTLDVPDRFRTVAELMKQEAGVESEGLPHVAQLMSDVHRRLDLGRADDPVQKREDEVIAALDKLLKEMEEQQQQQQQSNGGGGASGNQNIPGQQGADQSMLKGSSGKGEADRKELTENGNWGMLDQKAETQARELIRQQFPPNFLDAIGRYTRRLAEQKK